MKITITGALLKKWLKEYRKNVYLNVALSKKSECLSIREVEKALESKRPTKEQKAKLKKAYNTKYEIEIGK